MIKERCLNRFFVADASNLFMKILRRVYLGDLAGLPYITKTSKGVLFQC